MNPPRKKPSTGRIILIGLIGNVMEWYDFAVYGFFASVIGKLFFPMQDPAASLIASFGAFAAGFLMRPLGGLLFGRIGDLIGRERAMTVSVIAMALPTILMAFMPTYASIGLMAPILLIALRIIQGLSVGGEFTSSLIFLTESAHKDRRAFTAIWGSWGATAGILLGSLTGYLLSKNLTDDQLLLWGWRVPFAAGGLVALVGWLIRRGHHSEPLKGGSSTPVRDAFTHYRWDILRVALLNIGTGVAYYTAFIYAVSYIRNIDDISETIALEINSIAMLVLLIVLPISAWLSDRIGRKYLLIFSISILTLAAIPLFELIQSMDAAHVLVGEILFALVVGLTTSGLVAYNVELMPAPVRCTGLAFAYNLSMGLFGGTTPLIAATLISYTGNPIAPAYWILAAALVSLFVLIFFTKETRHLSLH